MDLDEKNDADLRSGDLKSWLSDFGWLNLERIKGNSLAFVGGMCFTEKHFRLDPVLVTKQTQNSIT